MLETRRRFRGLLVASLLASIAPGCGGVMTFVMQEYDGPARPRSAVSSIRTDDRGPTLAAVDGNPVRVAGALEPGNRLHVEVLPGVHEVDVDVTESETGLIHAVPVRFVAEAGKVYRVEVRASEARAGGLTGDAYEVDRDSDARLAPAAPPPAPVGSGSAPAPLDAPLPGP